MYSHGIVQSKDPRRSTSVKELRLHTNCYSMSCNSLVEQSASIYSYSHMATHTYMYRSTDTNMGAHALDMHTSATPVV